MKSVCGKDIWTLLTAAAPLAKEHLSVISRGDNKEVQIHKECDSATKE